MRDTALAPKDVRGMVIRGARCAFGPSDSERASIQITGGRVTHIAKGHDLSVAGKSDFAEIDLSGFFVMPGLINAHDHLQFALHPRLADPPYQNYVDWGRDIHAKFPDVFARHRNIVRDVRLWWGGLRNLLSGVTTVIHHDPFWPGLERVDFPVRVVRNYGWGHSMALGGDLREARSMTPRGSRFVVHACEGVDELAHKELFDLDHLGLLNETTVLVHGLAVDRAGAELLQSRGVSLIICPSSNEFLFGRLPDVALLSGICNVALGSDSPLTSEGDLLDEVRFAVRSCGISPEAAYRMVTCSPAQMFGLTDGEGAIQISGAGGLIAVRDTNRSAADTLQTMSIVDVEFVTIRGQVQLASDAILARIPFSQRRGLEPLSIHGVIRWLRAPVTMLLRSAEEALGIGEVRLGGKPVHIPEIPEAQLAC